METQRVIVVGGGAARRCGDHLRHMPQPDRREAYCVLRIACWDQDPGSPVTTFLFFGRRAGGKWIGGLMD